MVASYPVILKMAGNAPGESTSKSTDFSKNPKIKSKYRSKKAKSRRKQLKFAREAKGRTGKDQKLSIEKESLLEQSSSLVQPSLEELGVCISPPRKKSRSEQKLCRGASISKKREANVLKEELTPKPKGFFMIDFEILEQVLAKSAVCISCKQGNLIIKERKKEGLARKLSFACELCGFTNSFATSKKCTGDETEKGSPGPKTYEANYRFVLGMRLIGKGLSGMNMLCGILGMPHAMKQSSYERILEKLEKAAENVANSSMLEAAKELNPCPDTVLDAKCMFDGTWQKRGFSSLIGGVSCISADTGKVIDFEILKKYCKGCQAIEKLDINSVNFDQMKLMHNCTKNYVGSSPAMEVDGVRRIFNRSISKRNMRYTH